MFLFYGYEPQHTIFSICSWPGLGRNNYLLMDIHTNVTLIYTIMFICWEIQGCHEQQLKHGLLFCWETSSSFALFADKYLFILWHETTWKGARTRFSSSFRGVCFIQSSIYFFANNCSLPLFSHLPRLLMKNMYFY